MYWLCGKVLAFEATLVVIPCSRPGTNPARLPPRLRSSSLEPPKAGGGGGGGGFVWGGGGGILLFRLAVLVFEASSLRELRLLELVFRPELQLLD